MPEIIKILLPTNIYTFSVWIIVIVLIILKSRRVSTKWFTIDLEKVKPTAGAHGELILKDRLLKEYKIYRTNILFEINKLQICFKSNFRDNIIDYIDSIKTCNDNDDCIIKNKQTTIRTYNTLLDLSLNTIVKPMIINMVFRNGFPAKEDNDEFEKKCIEKYNTILSALEINMETDWADFSINPRLFKHFYHNVENTKLIDCTCKETIKFFKLMIRQRDDMIDLVFKDFSKMFNNNIEKCSGYCKLILRELYE